jgi:tRNA pseudouridine32 synthase/23S rRNA pseudouridine746 synthase
LVIVHEDKNILVVDKPSGVLTVAGKDRSTPSLANTVYQKTKADLPSADHMVVHRLGMDTSGLIIMAKNKDAVRELNGVFRERKVDRRYEALVAGHIEKDEGIINLPIMRDYERPPYVRISTDEHQRALIALDPEEVGKKILEGPKESITKYEVVGREFLQGQPVTRVVLTSISGRYHQLNVHMAAYGHPIVGDQVYGHGGDALSNGGLTKDELDELAPNANRANEEMQMLLNEAVEYKNLPPCVHAKFIKFVHPITKKTFEFSTDSPF